MDVQLQETPTHACKEAAFHLNAATRASNMESRHLRVDIWVDADQHARGLAGGLRRSGDVVQIKLRVHIHQHALLHGQAQLPGQLAVPVEDRPAALPGLGATVGSSSGAASVATGVSGAPGQVQAACRALTQPQLHATLGNQGAKKTSPDCVSMPGRVKASHHGRAQLVPGHQHRAGAQRLQVAHDRHVVVGLDGIADDAVQAAQRGLVCCVVGAYARLAVQVEWALLDLAASKRISTNTVKLA